MAADDAQNTRESVSSVTSTDSAFGRSGTVRASRLSDVRSPSRTGVVATGVRNRVGRESNARGGAGARTVRRRFADCARRRTSMRKLSRRTFRSRLFQRHFDRTMPSARSRSAARSLDRADHNLTGYPSAFPTLPTIGRDGSRAGRASRRGRYSVVHE